MTVHHAQTRRVGTSLRADIPPSTPGAKKRHKSNVKGGQLRWMLGLTGVVGAIGLWQVAPTLGWVNPNTVPPFDQVLGRLIQALGEGSFWSAIGHTMLAWFIGMVVCIAAGTVLGLLIGSSSFLRRYTWSTIEFLRPIPSVALIPVAIILFGVNLEATLLLVIYGSFWPVLVQVLSGVDDVDKVALDTAKSFRFGRIAAFRHVVMPTTLPFLLTGVRLAAVFALLLAITAGLVIGTPGLGNEITQAQNGGATVYMYALVLTTGVIGVLVNIGVRQLEKAMLGWHPSVRGEVIV